MASTQTPYGFRAVNELGGLPYAGSTRSFPINPAGYGTNIFNGSLVYVAATGYLQIVTSVGSNDSTTYFPTGSGSSATNSGSIGVFVGCSYVNAQGQTIYSQYYPANSLNAIAFVVDDDRAVFQVQADNTVAASALGTNVFLSAVQSTLTGSTTNGNSTTAVSASSVATTAAFRIVGFVNNAQSQVGDQYTDLLVKFNPGYHSYTTAIGL
jgi:hypothetical protein